MLVPEAVASRLPRRKLGRGSGYVLAWAVPHGGGRSQQGRSAGRVWSREIAARARHQSAAAAWA